MNKPIAIIAGEPNSISSEIIFKSWKLRKKYFYKPFFVIGSYNLFKLQKKKLKYSLKIKKIKRDFSSKDLHGNKLLIYNVEYNQKKSFENISTKSNKYIFNCFNIAISLAKAKKISGIINCPISKETLFKNRHRGITEFLAEKAKKRGSEVMLIYSKKFSVAPLTTHIEIKNISKKINQKEIIKKIKIINSFYKSRLKKTPVIGILGLNPHNFSTNKKNDETKKIISAIKFLKKLKIKIKGPISPDTSFMLMNKYNFDVLFGMYHDQVLTSFKALFSFEAINITLGLPYIRISPDHGVAKDITGKNIANPNSLVQAIKFFNRIKF